MASGRVPSDDQAPHLPQGEARVIRPLVGAVFWFGAIYLALAYLGLVQ